MRLRELTTLPDNAKHRIYVSINGVQYLMEFVFRSRYSTWYLTLREPGGRRLVSGEALHGGQRLFDLKGLQGDPFYVLTKARTDRETPQLNIPRILILDRYEQ